MPLTRQRREDPAANVLITGASTGIGAALAAQLAARGARLAVLARRVNRLASLADRIEAEHGTRPIVIATDLARPGAARHAARTALSALGTIDVLVNNAGGGAGGTIWRAADGPESRDAFEINYWSPLAFISELVPAMLEQQHGVIVNVTSLAQVMTWPMMGPYTATKAALASATETLRLELLGTPVRVLEVIPGPVDTAIQSESALLPGFENALKRAPMGNPDVLAARIVRAIDTGRRRLVYPRSLLGAYLAPGITRRYISRAAGSHAAPAARNDARVMRSGSLGAVESRTARDAWERNRSRT